MLAAASAAMVAAVYLGVPSPRPIVRLSLAFAYASLLLLAATMVIGPMHVLRGRRSPVNSGIRRDIGIWGGILAGVHVFFGLQVHMGGAILLYFTPPPGEPFSLMRLMSLTTNYIGLIATLAIAMLLALSNDAALVRLGVDRWKRWQRWNYAVFSLVAVHGVIYQVMEKRAVLPATAFGLVILGVAGVRAAQLLRRGQPVERRL